MTVVVTREELYEIAQAAGGIESAVRAELIARYPELETQTIRRNRNTYLEVDYILQDLESYGPFS